jgi:hypothetical protein
MSAEKDQKPVSAVSAPAAMPAGAVFLSYASEDAQAAERIATALRSGGIEVWFDQSELRGGDVWDQNIRSEIRNCTLFIPIISHHTQMRLEGYFRREWKLAIERMHDLAEQKPFLMPVVIDGTRDQEAVVPEAFRAVQWTPLPAGETPSVFVNRVQRLLSGEASTVKRANGGARGHNPVGSERLLPAAITLVILGAAAYFTVGKLWIAKPPASSPTLAPVAATAAGLQVLREVGDYELAAIYGQWGNTAKALDLLESALPDPEPDLLYLKVDPNLDPLRHEPRFQAIERALKFPD